jgi:hypothetical protein
VGGGGYQLGGRVYQLGERGSISLGGGGLPLCSPLPSPLLACNGDKHIIIHFTENCNYNSNSTFYDVILADERQSCRNVSGNDYYDGDLFKPESGCGVW